MSYDNMSTVSQNVLKFYQQLTGEERRIPFIFDDFHQRDPSLFTSKLLIKFQNILRNTTQDIIRHRVKILFSVISSPITLERQKWKPSKMKGILFSSPPMSYDNLSSVSQNVLKFYQQLTGKERRIPFIFDNFHFCRSRVIGLDMTENRIFTLSTQVIVWHRICLQTDGHGETSISLQLRCGGYKKNNNSWEDLFLHISHTVQIWALSGLK
jgi:hypothetical protein